MSRNAAIVAFLGAISFMVGCQASQKTQTSMGVFPSEGPILSLGAGDSLGRRIYVNDLIIAAREQGIDIAVTAASETAPVSLVE